MKYIYLLIISTLLMGCSNKPIQLNKVKYELNFINSSKEDIIDITLYSIKTNKKLSFNFIPKGAFNSFYFYKNIETNNTIILSWEYKNNTYKHTFTIKEKIKPYINFIFFDNGKYSISTS